MLIYTVVVGAEVKSISVSFKDFEICTSSLEHKISTLSYSVSSGFKLIFGSPLTSSSSKTKEFNSLSIKMSSVGGNCS